MPATPSPVTAPTLRRPVSVARAAAVDRAEPVLRWSPLGTVDAAAIADVDPAGAVQARGAGWSIDWWIGAEDRWHHPSVEAAVRQRELEDTPVIETAMRVPGGDVVHRATGVRATSPGDGPAWDDSAVLIEVENLSSVPVALALVVSGLGLDGTGHLGEVGFEGPVLRLDGRVGAVVSRPPARLVVGSLGEAAGRLAAGADGPPEQEVPSDPDGRLEVAVIVPLPHTATVSVLVPRVVAPARRRWGRTASVPEPGAVFEAPPATAVVAGWQAHTRDAARVELPERRLDEVLAGSQRSLVLAAGDGFLGDEHPDGEVGAVADAATRAAAICELLARSGLSDPLEPLARALVATQRLNGEVRLGDGSDATRALIEVASPLLRPGSELWIDDLLGPVAKAVHRLRGRADRGATAVSAASLGRVVGPLRSIGQPDVADAAAELCARLAAATPDGEIRAVDTDALVDRALALRVGSEDDRAGHNDDRVAALVELARVGTAGTLVGRIDRQGVPVGSVGMDPAAVAARALAVLDLVLVETPSGLDLLAGWPDAWWGRPAEAHGIRTRWGRASFALRWHGERPALLWEIEHDGTAPGDDARPPELRATALDPAWRASARAGEALLGPVPRPASVAGAEESRTVTEADDDAAAGRAVDGAEDLPPPPAEGQSFS